MAQHHLADAWSETQQGAKQAWRQAPNDAFEDLERHRDLLVSLSHISRLVAQQELDRHIDQWRARTECEVLGLPLSRARWRLWRSA